MAQIKVEEIIDHLRREMKRALEAAVCEVDPDADLDPDELYRAFRRAVGRKCGTWETVPDPYVRH